MFSQHFHKLSGRGGGLCSEPLRWVVWATFDALSLSIGRVGDSTGSTDAEEVPFLTVNTPCLTHPI